MFELIEVIPKNKDHIDSLFNILKRKKFNISHKILPSYNSHRNFVENHPYRKWYLIKNSSLLAGSLYITYSNIIGLNILSNKIDDYIEAINIIIKKHQPLPPINSERSKFFLVNANPENLNLINALKSLNMNHIQNTYAYKDIKKIK